MRSLSLLCSILFICLLGACSQGNQSPKSSSLFDNDRPHNPWVFRSVLDSQARMVTLALHDNLWAAYNTDECTLYKAWQGHVHFDGAVYTTVHGPQPTTVGDSYMEPLGQQWSIRENGSMTPLSVQYNGHRFVEDAVELQYTLTDPQGRKIKITESPEYEAGENGQTIFVRTFNTSNVPPGAEIILSTTISSIALASNFSTNGKFEEKSSNPISLENLSGLSIDGDLVLNSDSETRVSASLTRRALIKNTRQHGNDVMKDIPEGARLIARSDCKTCHNTFRKTVGPAYMEIANKYGNTPENLAMLKDKVKNGGAGVWGPAAMTAHPDIEDPDLTTMIQYIMDLDAETESERKAMMEAEPEKELEYQEGESDDLTDKVLPGVRVKYFSPGKELTGLKDIDWDSDAQAELIIPTILVLDQDLSDAGDDFGLQFDGYVKIPKDNNYVFRLISDDGSTLEIDGNLIIDHGGFHGADAKDGEVALKEGYHPFKIQYFQGKGGKSVQLQWRSFNDNSFKVIPPEYLSHHRENQNPGGSTVGLKFSNDVKIPGDGYALEEVHPSFTVKQARPNEFLPKVGGLDFLSDGRMVVSTWDPAGTVYLVSGHETGDPQQMSTKIIAQGLAEPLGLKVVDDEIYVLQKQELTQLIDNDGDELIDEYKTISNDWLTSGNFHEFAFGLEYQNGHFYATLATAIQPGGASTNPQIMDRGRVAKISRETGEIEFIAHGLRTPNGIGTGVDGELFVADNQGDWLPASKIVHVQKDAWYGSRSVDFKGTDGLKETLPVVWLPQDEIGNSPSTPVYLDKGVYKGQMIHGEVTHGGIKRVFVEKVNGQYQGCVFRFIQGLEAGVNRIRWSPDGALYVGGIGSTGNWGHTGKLWYGLQRLEFNEDNSAFEMLAVRAKTNGVEIEFTEPLRPRDGWNPEDYEVIQWRYQPTENYGGPKLDEAPLKVKSASVSDDKRKVFLEIDGIKSGYQIVYIKLKNHYVSALNNGLWTTEAWYTMNQIPVNNMGEVRTKPSLMDNVLTSEEVADGWKLLFDGKSTEGWTNFGKSTIGSDWVIRDNALTLNVIKEDGKWQSKDGGDIVTTDEFENYELSLEWKVGACGNSGIMFNVVDDGSQEYPWRTGPEMQILDNVCHPDASIITHRAGDLYDMISCTIETVKPAGQWNQVRIVINNGHLEQWLNGHKVVETEMFTPEWEQMIAGSKFKDMEGFGMSRKGKISLQDHGDPIAFKNIKIREIKDAT